MRGPFSTPITPLPGSFFHADPQHHRAGHIKSTQHSISKAWQCSKPASELASKSTAVPLWTYDFCIPQSAKSPTIRDLECSTYVWSRITVLHPTLTAPSSCRLYRLNIGQALCLPEARQRAICRFSGAHGASDFSVADVDYRSEIIHAGEADGFYNASSCLAPSG
jgi:hypothetical protein